MVLALGLCLGGALGDATDRLLLGYLRDMFDLQWLGLTKKAKNQAV